MTPQEQQSAYRATCTLRRKGATVLRWEAGLWAKVDLDSWEWPRHNHATVNRAKRFIRKHTNENTRSYTI